MADRGRKRGHFLPAHGGYALLRQIAAGGLDRRIRPAKALRSIVAGLASDLGGQETLSVAQRLILQEVAVKTVVLRAMAGYALASGVLDGKGQLLPVLGEKYLAWSNSVRHDLIALFGPGLARHAKDVDIAVLLSRPTTPAE